MGMDKVGCYACQIFRSTERNPRISALHFFKEMDDSVIVKAECNGEEKKDHSPYFNRHHCS